ncbi:MAG: hypothetical protein R2815_07915 [Flavobacteriales bacterium]
MFAGLFRSNRPAILLVLVVLVPALFWPTLSRTPWSGHGSMPLFGLLQRAVGDSSWANGALGLALTVLIAAQLAYLVNARELMQRRNHLPALFFVLVLAALGKGPLLIPALAGMPFVLLALHRAWSMNNMGSALAPLFDAGSLLGVAALFYLPYAFLVVVLWGSTSVIRPFHWRDHVVPVVGCSIAFFLAWACLRLAGATPWHPFYTLMNFGGSTGLLLDLAPQRIFLYLVLSGMLLVGAVAFARAYATGVMREKNLRSSFLSLCAALGVVVASGWLLDHTAPAVLVAVPFAVFTAYAVQHGRRPLLGEFTVLALVLLAVWGQWGR